MKKSLLSLFLDARTFYQSMLFLLIGTILSAQDIETYAISQTNKVGGICIGCSILNPQAAVGNNENDFSTLKVGLGVLGYAEQTLIFPQVSNGDLFVEFGTGDVPLSLELLSGVTMETLKGTTSNNDIQIVQSSILAIGSDNEGTIQLKPKKDYDRVRIRLAGTVALNDGLRIYWAATHTGYGTECNVILPADPFLPVTFSNALGTQPNEELICGKSLHAGPNATNSEEFISDTIYKRTISFWAKVGGSLRLNSHGTELFIGDGKFTAEATARDQNSKEEFIYSPEGKLAHYLVEIIPEYGSGNLLCELLAEEEDCKLPTKLHIKVTIRSNSGMQSHTLTLDNAGAISGFRSKEDLNVSVNNATVDEIFIYNRILNSKEIKALTCSYQLPEFNAVNCLQATGKSIDELELQAEVFTVSPNPTSGRITIGGNILLLDSDISLHNMAGNEVYHSRFSSNTFDLPQNLPSGVYTLHVTIRAGKSYSKRIILNH